MYLPHHFVVFSHMDVIDGGVNAHEERRWMHVSLACSIHSGPRGGGWKFSRLYGVLPLISHVV